jgi:hypothetical protein
LHRTCFTQGRGGKIMKNRHVWKQWSDINYWEYEDMI